MRIPSPSVKKTLVICIVVIIALSFSLFFYFQQQTEQSIRTSIYDQEHKNQKDLVRALSQHIRSDLESIMLRLQGLASSKQLQQGDFLSNNTRSLLESHYHQVNQTTPVDRLFIIDQYGINKMAMVPQGEPSYIGNNVSYREWVKKTKDTLSPQFSDSFVGLDGKRRIAITYPIIIDGPNGTEYIGLVGATIPTIELFRYYGNVYDIESKYLSVLDSKGILLVHPLSELIGKPFHGDYFQNISSRNEVLNNLIETVVYSGKPASATYEFVNGERFTTGYPIILNGIPEYSVFLITPTLSIYSKIDSIIAIERLQMFSLIAGIVSAVIILVLFLSRLNNILDKEVIKRTKDLETSNANLSVAYKKLESANKQLERTGIMQKEFINTAAHELRTPIQPILGGAELMRANATNSQQAKISDTIVRNAKRLRKLADDILDVTKIESNALKLNIQNFDLNDLILDIVKEFSNVISIQNKKIRFEIGKLNSPGIVVGDKNRISQVLSNLIENSIKFASDGQEDCVISINVKETSLDHQIDDAIGSCIVVSIKDNGKGIDVDMMPRLFTKFTSKSYQGTGLGLYISKSIIEAHGGKMEAKNNDDGKGATFSFTLITRKV